MIENCLDGSLADRRAASVDAAHAGLRGEGYEGRGQFAHVAAADAVFLLGQHDDRTPLGSFVRERRKLRRVGQFLLADAANRTKRGRLTVAERDGTGLVEQ